MGVVEISSQETGSLRHKPAVARRMPRHESAVAVGSFFDVRDPPKRVPRIKTYQRFLERDCPNRRGPTTLWRLAVLICRRGTAMAETRKLAAILAADVAGYSKLAAGKLADRAEVRAKGTSST